LLKTSRYAVGLLLLATLTACSDSGDGGTTPPPTPTIAIAVSPASVNITAGSNGQTGITLTRGGGYTGAVALSLEGAPAGVTGGFNPATIATGATTSTLTIDVAGSTAAGTYTLTVRATGSGVTAATATVSITVAPQPSFALSLTPAALNITAGEGGNTTVNINRTNYLGPVTLALEGAPAGITGTFTPNPSQANSSALALTVANSVAPGPYNITVRGTSNVLPAQTAQLTVTVLAPAGSFTLSLSPATLNITQGQAANTTVNINRTGGFAANVTLSLEGAPAGVTGAFTPNPAGGAASTLAVTVGAGTAPGNYNLTVRGTTPNPSPDGSLTPAAVAQMAPDQTIGLTLVVAVAGNYTLSATAATAAQGATGTSTVTLTRTGGNTSSVTLALEGAPAGVTGAFAPSPTAGTTSTLTLTVGAAVAVGNYNLTVRGTAAGLADQTTSFQLSVTATGFTLLANPDDLSVTTGGNNTATININRTGGFAGSVALTHTTTAPAGVTISFNPTATTGNTSTMTVTVGGGVAVGNYPITIKGNATGQPERTTSVNLRVVAGGSGNVTWTFCDQTGLPIWLAVQNGNGSAAWTRVTPTGNTYNFTIATAGGVAWVEQNGASQFQTTIVYGNLAEIQAQAPACVAGGTTKTINGTVANLPVGSSVYLSLGGGFTTFQSASPGFPNWSVSGVRDGTIDLFASTVSGFPVQTVGKAIIRRDLPNPAGGSTLPVLDWNAAEAFTPETRNITITNPIGALNNAGVSYATANGTGGILAPASSGASTYRGVPVANQQPGDLHLLTVLEAQGAFNWRTITKMFQVATNQTLTFGSQLGVAGWTWVTTPYVRPRVQATIPADYNRLWMTSMSNRGGTQNGAVVMGWEGYGFTTALDYQLPDFSGVAGWNNAWGMQTGTGFAIDVMLTVNGWVLGAGAGQQPQAEGTVITSATSTQAINP